MKKRFIKIMSIFLTVVFIASTFTGMSFTSFAASKGSQSISASAQDNVAKVSMSLFDASYTSGNTATYIVDKYYYKTMADFGNMYSVTFEGYGMYAFTDITASGAFSISNSGHRDTFMINPSQNALATVTDTGALVGAVPEPGTSKSVTIQANVTVNWNNPALLNGMPVFSNSTSVSMTAVVIGVDSTQLQNEILLRSEYIESCWTPDSWATFAQALDNAKSVASSKTALQDEIDNALAQLQEARQGLVHAGDITECEYCAGQSNGNESKTIESFYDLSYGNSNMDLFLPANAEGNCALIVFIHGGAWVSDDKASFTGWALEACRKYGIAAASVNYRYADCFNVTGWGILDDIQSAVAKIKSVAAERGLNITKMMTAGHSAGGHLSLMYAYTKKDSSPARPVCVFDMSGPAALYNPEYLKDDGLILALNAVSGVYFTREQATLAYGALLEMSPVHYVNSETVPTLICHGALDIIVPYSDSVALDMNLTNAGVAHTFITFPLSNHGLESNPECYEQMMQEYDRYVRTYLIPGEVPTVVHNYTSEVVPASCTNKGYTIYTCSDCGRYYIGDVIPITHNGGETVIENETEPTCSEFGGYDEVTYCLDCGAEASRNHVQIDKLPHTPGQTVVENEVAPTCSAFGSYDNVVYCTVCGEEVSRESQSIDKIEHTPVIDAAYSPSCTQVGKTQGSHCSVCGEILVAQEDITALGHTPMDPVRENETAPTCSEFGGYDEVVYCTVCHGEISRNHTQIAKTTHKAGAWEVSIPATYITEGQQVKRCVNCGIVLATKPLSVLEPEFSANEGSLMSFDESCSVLKNIPQGTTDLSELLTLGGCTVEASDEIIKTGTQITIKNLLGTVLATYTASVSGDLTGDGYVDAFDLALVGEYINTFTEPEDEAFMNAADIFDDGYLDATDLAYLIYIANFEAN